MKITEINQINPPCPECGHDMLINIWHIIDRSERPDLWERCKRGTLGHISCSQGHWMRMTVSVLLHDSVKQQIIYAYSLHKSDEEMEHAINEKFDLIRNRLGRDVEKTYKLYYTPEYLLPLYIMPPCAVYDDLTPMLDRNSNEDSSYAATVATKCIECNVEFNTLCWTVIIREEKPDLWDAFFAAQLNTCECPNGHLNRIDATTVAVEADSRRALICRAQLNPQANQQNMIEMSLLVRSLHAMTGGDAGGTNSIDYVTLEELYEGHSFSRQIEDDHG